MGSAERILLPKTNYLDRLREKWAEVPIGLERVNTELLLDYSDHDLLKLWEDIKRKDTEGERFGVRGWYHLLYKDLWAGKKVMDVGSGLGTDGLSFAQAGARVVFVDIVRSNLEVLRRLAKIMQLDAVDFFYLDRVESLCPLSSDFDVIFASGSLHNAPFEVLKPEVQEIVRCLKIGGRWLQLAYPKQRWIKEGRLPFETWGGKTDGEKTPWVEWYDPSKLLKLFAPFRFELVFYYEFHNGEFNWFDLVKRLPLWHP